MSHELGSKPKKILPFMKGYNSFIKTMISVNSFNKNQTAQYRLKVINHYQEFGLEATLSAFTVIMILIEKDQSDPRKQE